jgi:hypothetical protein
LQQLYGPAHQFTLANRSEGGVAVTLRLPFREHSDGFSALAGASGEPAVPVAN